LSRDVRWQNSIERPLHVDEVEDAEVISDPDRVYVLADVQHHQSTAKEQLNTSVCHFEEWHGDWSIGIGSGLQHLYGTPAWVNWAE
jgi:hypothetical protein